MIQKMNVFATGIICGLIATVVFTIYVVLAQATDFHKPAVVENMDPTIKVGGNATGVHFPLYDIDELPEVLAAMKQYPVVPFDVSINPSSGPGTGPSAAWASAITQLKTGGAIVTGYVPTGYGNASIVDVENMVLSYNKFYPHMLDGIMFDEVSSSQSQFKFYQTISNYTRSLGYLYVVANPGSFIDQKYISLFDQTVIYESAGYPDESMLISRTFYPQYSKSATGFEAAVTTTPTYDSSWLHMATKYLKWIYITDQTDPNPYAVTPPYFDQYISDLSSLDILPSIENLSAVLKTMHLTKDEMSSLDSKLYDVMDSFSLNNTAVTKNRLDSFINEVDAQKGKTIPPNQALELTQTALNIKNSIH